MKSGLSKLLEKKELERTLKKFIMKNSVPEKGQKVYMNWQVYNSTYKEVLSLVV
jgi:pimeloyl-CoA synthetase